jgi:hypothetical protein
LIAAGSPKIKKGKYELFTEGLDPEQIRNGVWYWNKKTSFLGRIKKLLKRLMGI